MADYEDYADDASAKEVEVEGSSVPVYEDVTDEDGRGSDEWHQSQAQALLDYKAGGLPGVYADPSRDQEPDIAPELGVSPHPELANPAPPDSTWAASTANTWTTQAVGDKEDAGKDVAKAEAKQDKADAKADKQAAKESESDVSLSPGDSVEVSAEKG